LAAGITQLFDNLAREVLDCLLIASWLNQATDIVQVDDTAGLSVIC